MNTSSNPTAVVEDVTPPPLYSASRSRKSRSIIGLIVLPILTALVMGVAGGVPAANAATWQQSGSYPGQIALTTTAGPDGVRYPTTFMYAYPCTSGLPNHLEMTQPTVNRSPGYSGTQVIKTWMEFWTYTSSGWQDNYTPEAYSVAPGQYVAPTQVWSAAVVGSWSFERLVVQWLTPSGQVLGTKWLTPSVQGDYANNYLGAHEPIPLNSGGTVNLANSGGVEMLELAHC